MTKPIFRVQAGRHVTDNVVPLDVVTSLDLTASRVLNGASNADMESVVVLGWRQDGSEYFASSIADGADVLWLMERLKAQLLTAQPPDRAVDHHDGHVIAFHRPDTP